MKNQEEEIYQFCKKISNCYTNKNKIIISGIGKNLLLSEVISEFLLPFNILTLSLDPCRAVHGNLGVISCDDILIVLSKSGNTQELVYLINCIENKFVLKNKFLLTTQRNCLLSHYDFKEILEVKSTEELSKFGHSPQMTFLKFSIVLIILINTLAQMKNIDIIDYLKNHPSGEIGKNLNLIS